VPDALGGAEASSAATQADKRVLIDFRRDLISITRSRGARAAANFVTIPVTFERGQLLVASALVGGIPTRPSLTLVDRSPLPTKHCAMH
jgi:hypothetical protein